MNTRYLMAKISRKHTSLISFSPILGLHSIKQKTKTNKKQTGVVAQTEGEEFRHMAHSQSAGQSVPLVRKRHQKAGQKEFLEHWLLYWLEESNLRYI